MTLNEIRDLVGFDPIQSGRLIVCCLGSKEDYA